jgi:hypothetical protein
VQEYFQSDGGEQCENEAEHQGDLGLQLRLGGIDFRPQRSDFFYTAIKKDEDPKAA